MLDRIEFILSEAFIALRRNTWMTFAAITTSAVALYLLGGLALVYLGVQRYAQTLPGRFTMEVFLRDDVVQPQIREAARRIRAIPGVKSAVWIPRDLFWEQEKKKYPPAVTEGIENPLPDKFKVTLERVEEAERVAANIRLIPQVDPKNVLFQSGEQRLIADVLALLRLLGLSAGGLLFLTSGVLIYNAIRLTIVARWREMRIMRLVGATPATVSLPLLVEGMIQGALGGLLAAGLIGLSHAGLQRLVESLMTMGRLADIPLVPIAALLAAVGSAYGFACSALALREPGRAR